MTLSSENTSSASQSDDIDKPGRAASEVLWDTGRRGAKKRAILTILRSGGVAQSTSSVVMQLAMHGIDGATVENTSPQLSAYKSDELVDLTPDGWKITQQGCDYLAEKN